MQPKCTRFLLQKHTKAQQNGSLFLLFEKTNQILPQYLLSSDSRIKRAMMQTSCIENRKIVIRVFGGGESSWQIGPFTMALEKILSDWKGKIDLINNIFYYIFCHFVAKKHHILSQQLFFCGFGGKCTLLKALF